jgi:ABC-2 type transport system ATP-binding protein
MNCIELTNVTKTYSAKTAVNNLSLEIPEGCVYGFIGPNGSGKTTTLRMILNIIYPDSGRISVFGQTLNKMHSSRIGYLPEERGLYKKMKVRELIRFFAKLKGGTDIESRIGEWLERFELQQWANKKIDALSKGMSQKVQFIATVITEPELLILDEPFSGLDPVNMEIMRSAVLDMQKRGSTIVFSTHDMGTAERMCDRILMIHEGEKVLDGTLQSIQDQYGSDTIRVRIKESGDTLPSLPGVDKVTDFGREQELKMKPTSNPQEILKKLVETYTVQRFEVAKPSLHDIFVRIAGTESPIAAQKKMGGNHA